MRTGLHLFDTKSSELHEVQGDESGKVRIYCCGPTVYRDAHVGNLRTFLLADLVQRALIFAGMKVDLVQNITDVGHMSEDLDEDKMLSESKLKARDPFEIAKEYEGKFHHDLTLLNAIPARLYPRASESIEMMQELIATLMKNKNAYLGEDGTVYFSAESFPGYGEISGNRLQDLKPGHRYEYVENGAKRFHADWALWKAAGNRTQMIWPSPWGDGFPGWHIECSAMSLHFLDSHVDLHIGGIDLRFPHHENERAQSNSAMANQEVVDLWLHGEHLLFEGRKMSKSAGNVVLVSDLIARGLNPLALRLTFLENRYRSQMNLTWDSLKAADATISRWREKYHEWKKAPAEEAAAEIAQAFSFVQKDLDTPKTILFLREIEKGGLSEGKKAAIFRALDQLLALDITTAPVAKVLSAQAVELIELRKRARAEKNFAESDRLRDELIKLGVDVKDGSL
jgi:cysteinyl-tRNA synthetase